MSMRQYFLICEPSKLYIPNAFLSLLRSYLGKKYITKDSTNIRRGILGLNPDSSSVWLHAAPSTLTCGSWLLHLLCGILVVPIAGTFGSLNTCMLIMSDKICPLGATIFLAMSQKLQICFLAWRKFYTSSEKITLITTSDLESNLYQKSISQGSGVKHTERMGLLLCLKP